MTTRRGKSVPQGEFEPTVDSLLAYKCPEWFRDAKFGIYLHWGVYSVAERGEWYARDMYREGSDAYRHHVATYGHPSKFGYKDFIPMWKAEKFDPDRLVGLFKRAGAKYFTPCAVHHDNFDLWNSRYHRWNSVKMGPKKDLTGLWREATLRQGLRFGVTTHLERTWSWFNVNKGADRTGKYKGVPYDGNDLAFRDYYLDPSGGDTNGSHPRNAPASWRRTWARRMKDLIDRYHPDHLYFDGAVPFLGDDRGRTGVEVIAHFYNASMRCHDGRQEGVMCFKKHDEHGFYFDGIGTRDIEGGKADVILSEPWQTDHSIGPWGYYAGAKYRPVSEVIHWLVDIVSKNGNLLLNVPPRADGTLDGETEEMLAAIGRWMDVNGEAIYGTRPWKVSWEGEVRFTRKGGTLYATTLKWPDTGEINITGLGLDSGAGRAGDVSLLGYGGKVKWRQTRKGLRISMPAVRPCEHAWAFRIRLGP